MRREVPIEAWQIWRADLDPTVGREQAKVRPVVVVSSPLHIRLTRAQLFMILPITTTDRRWGHHVKVYSVNQTGWVMTEQLRTISAERLIDPRPVGKLMQDEITEIRRLLSVLVDLSPS